MFTADQVFAAAMAAHRINDGYFKEDQWNTSTAAHFRSKEANKLMVKRWIRTNDFVEVTAEDVEKGQLVRNHFRSYMFLAIAGKLNDFQAQAYKISQKDSFTERDGLEIAVASCLPMVYEKDRAKKEFMEALRDSTQLTGTMGDRIEGEIIVLDSRYNVNFNKWKISAKMVDSYIDFWYNKNIAKGTVLRIKGKIKAMRGDNTTQLNYVKEVG
jgi:hypothetical protein